MDVAAVRVPCSHLASLCSTRTQRCACPGRQVIIMLTPVRRIFHCEEQNGFEWLYAVLTGAGSLLVALATKLVTWCALALISGTCLAGLTVSSHSVWLSTGLRDRI